MIKNISVLALVASTQAINIKRDPLIAVRGPGSLPAYFDPTPSFPHNYYVPNFGVDEDIAATQSHSASAEAKFGYKWNPKSFHDVPKETAQFWLA